MRSRSTKALLTITAIGALALPVAAQARQGADDAAGHVRHSATEVHHAAKHHARHHARHSGVELRHGADDGPAHT